MAQINLPSFLLLLLAVALLPAASAALVLNTTELDAIANCTESQVSEITSILGSNALVLNCEANLDVDSLFNVTDLTALCADSSCVSGLNALNDTLPECKHSGWAYQHISESLASTCSLTSFNSSASDAESLDSSSGSASLAPVATTGTPLSDIFAETDDHDNYSFAFAFFAVPAVVAYLVGRRRPRSSRV